MSTGITSKVDLLANSWGKVGCKATVYPDFQAGCWEGGKVR